MHDSAYNRYLAAKKNPYLYFNKADEQFIKDTNHVADWGGRLGNLFFRGKRALAPKLDEPDLAPPGKKPRKNPPPKHIFVNLAKKRKNTDPGEGPSNQRGRMSDNGESSETAQGEQSTFSTGGGSGGGGGAGGGRGGGVGHSTGSYDNRTLWHFNADGTVDITCYSSRLVHCTMPQEEFYRTVPVDTRNNGSVTLNGYGFQDMTHVQVTTPWKLVDPNAWGVWFSPADFQHLVNTCESLDLVSLDQEIFNVVLKTVTETGPADAKVKVYNNDLTAALLVAEDSNNTLPYTPAAMRCETLGFYPWLPTVPTNYRYYSQWIRGVRPTQSGNTRNRDKPEKPRTKPYDREVSFSLTPGTTQTAEVTLGPTDQPTAEATAIQPRAADKWFAQQLQYPQFFTIETSLPISMVRTGDSWASGHFTFDTRTIKLTRNWQTMRAMGMPPQIVPPTSSNNDGTLAQTSGSKRLGIGWGNDTHTSEATMVRPTTTGYEAPEWMFINTQAGPAIANGPLGSRTTQHAPHWDNGVHSVKYDREHGGILRDNNNTPTSYRLESYERGGTTYKNCNWVQKQLSANNVTTPSEFLGQESTGTNGPLGAWVPYMLNTFGPYTSYPDPGHHYPWGQIWDKRPDYELKAHFQPTAPFLTDNPPGQILIKIAPNLTDNYNPSGSTYSRIITYCDFWWKGTLKFKAKLRAPHQYSLVHFWNNPNTVDDLSVFYPNRMGEMQLPHITTKVVPKVAY